MFSKVAVSLFFLCCMSNASESSQEKAFALCGDILRVALPLAAGGYTLLEHDYEGTLQYGESFGTAALITGWTKLTIPKTRPDTEPYSFVSGHTSMTFAPAVFLYKRYGPRIGIPALGLALVTGATRIAAHKHYPEDVIAGALVGILPALYFTTPRHKSFALVPKASGRSTGIQLKLTL